MSLSPAAVWLLILVIGAGTFALRLSFIQWFGRRPMPSTLMCGLNHVPAAVLAALAAPAALYGGDASGLHWDNPRLYAALVAALAAWYGRGPLWAFGAGMGSLWLLQFAAP